MRFRKSSGNESGQVKRRVFLSLAIVLMLGIAGCPRLPVPEQVEPTQEPVYEPLPEVTTVTSELVQGLKLELSVPKVNFQPGETVIATLSLINTTQDAISFETRTSQLFDLIIEGPGRERRWSDDKMFLTVITPRHIPPNQALSKDLPWEVNLARGELFLVGVTVGFEVNGERVELRSPPIRLDIGAS
ncbi:BsuPI-related putative proteinase inhibitor [Dehalococcoidia bacterium]|nr:BsuPI-related putative proteinase inhibitor [Dehalococcoidia bacterium]